jgi:riboflavin synthase
MFTGLIEAVGRVERLAASDGAADVRLRVATPLGAGLEPGESVAVNGVCLTVVSADAAGFDAVLSPETLRVTALGGLTAGRDVNLERAVRADARLGGHFVLGHVDGVGRVASVGDDGESRRMEIDLPAELMPGLVGRGSVAVDGISLTVASIGERRIGLQIVPFTLAHTALAAARPGDAVNIETDVIGKYVARLMAARLTPAGGGP